MSDQSIQGNPNFFNSDEFKKTVKGAANWSTLDEVMPPPVSSPQPDTSTNFFDPEFAPDGYEDYEYVPHSTLGGQPLETPPVHKRTTITVESGKLTLHVFFSL
jgi:hypothetical protein